MTEARAGHIEADVAVVGAGPAGIAAAAHAAEAGARVALIDEAPLPGGQIWRHRSRTELPALARRSLERLDRSGATVLCGTTVVDATPDGRLTAQARGRPLVVHARRLVLATGARERFVPFPGWTLPNVVGVGGAQALLKAGTPFAWKRVVVAGSGPLLLPVAAALAHAGAYVALVAEQAPRGAVLRFGAGLWRLPGKALQAAAYRSAFRRARYAPGTWVTRAEGDDVLRQATLTDGRRTWTEPCDVLCTAYGLVPSVELARLLGCEVQAGAVIVDARQQTSVPGVFCAGEPTGIGGMEAALAEGGLAGQAAAPGGAVAAGLLRTRERYRRFAASMERAFAPREEVRALAEPDTIVCRCEDVCLGQLRPEWGARQAKLYTRAGMGPCQGRVCGPALEFLFDCEPDTIRAPLAPVTVDTLCYTDASADAP